MTDQPITRRTRREGTYHCEKCGTAHYSMGRHDDGTPVTMDDRPGLMLDILRAYAAIDGHASLADVRDDICPKPARRAGANPHVVDRRTIAGRAWSERFLEASDLAFAGMTDTGLLQVVNEPCGDHWWGFAITDAGRARLAELDTEAATA